MGLDVWFREDIQRALRAAMTATANNRSASADYLDGYASAIATIAAAFGISLAEAKPERQRYNRDPRDPVGY